MKSQPGATLTRAAPFRRRLMGYLAERFPLVGHGVLIVSYYSSNQFLARALVEPGTPMRYELGSLMGAITLLCVFFHLRVFDEHKDYAQDLEHHPERLLQRGVVTLGELRRLGIAAIALELLLASLWSSAALIAVLTVLAFSLLMLKEFFVADWLRRHFLVYAFTHMLIMPLMAMIPLGFAMGVPFWAAPGWFWLYAFVGFFVTFNWEISRKIRAPDDERTGLDSYSRIFGTYGAAWMVLAVRVVDTGLVALVGHHLGLGAWFYWALVALFGVCTWGFVQYRRHTTTRNAKRLETYAGLYIVAFDLILAVELGRMLGVEWGDV